MGWNPLSSADYGAAEALPFLQTVLRQPARSFADLSRAALEALSLEDYRSQRLSEGQVRRMQGFRTRIR
jgi:hypothetical protein